MPKERNHIWQVEPSAGRHVCNVKRKQSEKEKVYRRSQWKAREKRVRRFRRWQARDKRVKSFSYYKAREKRVRRFRRWQARDKRVRSFSYYKAREKRVRRFSQCKTREVIIHRQTINSTIISSTQLQTPFKTRNSTQLYSLQLVPKEKRRKLRLGFSFVKKFACGLCRAKIHSCIEGEGEKPMIHPGKLIKYLDGNTVMRFLSLCPGSADVRNFLRNSRYPAHWALDVYVPVAGTNTSLP